MLKTFLPLGSLLCCTSMAECYAAGPVNALQRTLRRHVPYSTLDTVRRREFKTFTQAVEAVFG